MPEQENDVLSQLLRLIANIREQTAEFEQQQHDSQQWYDRGYADGIVKALCALGYQSHVTPFIDTTTNGGEAISPHLPWGQAYHHGVDMGERETYEVMGTPDEA